MSDSYIANGYDGEGYEANGNDVEGCVANGCNEKCQICPPKPSSPTTKVTNFRDSDNVLDINSISHMNGEEKPHIILNCIENLFNERDGVIKQNPDNICKYTIEFGEIKIPYSVCDSDGTSPDLIIIRNGGLKLLFVEITKGSFKGSGNSMQYQRFTKFIPVLKDRVEMIYYLETEDVSLSGKDVIAMTCWKKNNIILKTNSIPLQNCFDKLDLNEFTIEEFSKKWNAASKPSTSGAFKGEKQSIELLSDKIIVSNFNVLNNGKLRSDPGIGTTMLVLSTLLNFNSGKQIIITGQRLSQNLIDKSSKNKYIKFVCKLKKIFDVDIIIEGVSLPNCCLDYTSLDKLSNSEKCVSIHEELLLINNGFTICYSNHARGEQEYLIIKDKKYSVEKSVYKPDLIYVDNENKTIWFVEAEKYKNYKTGVSQIQSWKSVKTKNFYKNKVKGTEYNEYKFRAYIILYDGDNKVSECNLQYVKKIVNSNRVTYDKCDCEYIELF